MSLVKPDGTPLSERDYPLGSCIMQSEMGPRELYQAAAAAAAKGLPTAANMIALAAWANASVDIVALRAEVAELRALVDKLRGAESPA